MNKTNLKLCVILPVILCFPAAQAESEKGQFGIGLSTSNRLSFYEDDSGDHVIEVHPHLQYRGDRFNILGDTMAYNFSNAPNLRMEVIGKLENRGYDGGKVDSLKGMADRDASVDVGGRMALHTDMGLFSIDATTDASGTHKGHAVDLRFGPDLYKQKWNGSRELSVGMLAGVKWESDEVVNYYYGVRDSEATASRAAYQGKAAITPYLGLDAQLSLTPHITLEGNILYRKNPDEITDSPIVDDSQSVEANVGLTYWF